MASEAYWLDEAHTIAYGRVYGVAEARELLEMMDKQWSLIQPVDYPIYQISDFSEVLNVPRGIVSHFPQVVTHPNTKHQYSRLLVLILTNPVHVQFAQTYINFQRTKWTFVVRTLDEALVRIEADRQTVQPPSPQ